MGPTLNNLHNLIRLPFGCGEQNMIHFAPIVYVMHYLQHTNQLDKETEIEANTFLVQGMLIHIVTLEDLQPISRNARINPISS